jgi:hypothetical protein
MTSSRQVRQWRIFKCFICGGSSCGLGFGSGRVGDDGLFMDSLPPDSTAPTSVTHNQMAQKERVCSRPFGRSLSARDFERAVREGRQASREEDGNHSKLSIHIVCLS